MSEGTEHPLIEHLSEHDKIIFKDLLSKVQQYNGDFSQLTDEENDQLAGLVAQHNSSIDMPTEEPRELPEEITENMPSKESDDYSAAELDETDYAKVTSVSEMINPSTNEFAVYVLGIINDSLCHGGASREDAVRYAFHNKWLPDELKNRDKCEEVFYRYIDDIELLNINIDQQIQSNASKDAIVAVGLAWFTTLYQCYQLVEANGEL